MRHDLCSDLCVAGIDALGVVGLEDRVELNWRSALAASCFTSRIFRKAAGKSARDRIGAVGLWLFKLIVHTFSYRSRFAEWQRMSGLLLRVRPSVCKTLQSMLILTLLVRSCPHQIRKRHASKWTV